MDLDLEQYNYALDASLQHSIKFVAGISTQLLDAPVTRSYLLFENRALLQLPPNAASSASSAGTVASSVVDASATSGTSSTSCSSSTSLSKCDISVYLENAPNNGIPNKLRGVPVLFGITIISHLSAYLLDKIIPNDLVSSDGELSNLSPPFNEEQAQQQQQYLYCYSWSMHLYMKCKVQNLNTVQAVPRHHHPAQIVDANLIANDNDNDDENDNQNNNNNNDNDIASAQSEYRHNWDHSRLVKKMMISCFTSLLTYPLHTIYTKIAFDIGQSTPSTGIQFKYNINGFCTNIASIAQQMMTETQTDRRISFASITRLYRGFGVHLFYILAYQSLIHYSREFLIEISPKIHSSRVVNRYLSAFNDPFEYSMFCIWWIPPVICRILCYPLIKLENHCIVHDMDVFSLLRQSVSKWHFVDYDTVVNILKNVFHGVIGNTTRFMTEIQMAELFGLWSLIRVAHQSQYKQLVYEQPHNECAICYDDRGKADIVFIPCGHKFCKQDAYDVISRNMNCPTCMTPIKSSFADLGAWKKLFLL